jgi:hypothetical protein
MIPRIINLLCQPRDDIGRQPRVAERMFHLGKLFVCHSFPGCIHSLQYPILLISLKQRPIIQGIRFAEA